jgi:hypothetical protein
LWLHPVSGVKAFPRRLLAGAYHCARQRPPASFTPHSGRAAAASWAWHANVPLATILEQCRWAHESTFTRFYLRRVAGTDGSVSPSKAFSYCHSSLSCLVCTINLSGLVGFCRVFCLSPAFFLTYPAPPLLGGFRQGGGHVRMAGSGGHQSLPFSRRPLGGHPRLTMEVFSLVWSPFPSEWLSLAYSRRFWWRTTGGMTYG